MRSSHLNRQVKLSLAALLLLFVLFSNSPVSARTTIGKSRDECKIYIMLQKEFYLMMPPGFDKKIEELQDVVDYFDDLVPEYPEETTYVNQSLEKFQEKLQNYKNFKADTEAALGTVADEDLRELRWAFDQGVEKVWNEGGRTFGCCSVQILFNYTSRDFDDPPTPGHDQVGIVLSEHFRSFVELRGTPDDDEFAIDHFSQDTNALWMGTRPAHVTEEEHATMAAHEAGHEMGLPDRYEDVAGPGGEITSATKDSAEEDDLMADSWNGKAKLSDIHMILEKNGVTCPVRCCPSEPPPPPADEWDFLPDYHPGDALKTSDSTSDSTSDTSTTGSTDAVTPASEDATKTSSSDDVKSTDTGDASRTPKAGDTTSTGPGDPSSTGTGDPTSTSSGGPTTTGGVDNNPLPPPPPRTGDPTSSGTGTRIGGSTPGSGNSTSTTTISGASWTSDPRVQWLGSDPFGDNVGGNIGGGTKISGSDIRFGEDHDRYEG